MAQTRILQIANTLAHTDGGPARNSFELNLALNRQVGVVAALVSMRHSSASVVADYVNRGGTLPPIPPKAVRLGRRAASIRPFTLVRLMKRADVVVIHGYFLNWVPVMAGLARLFKKPVLIMPHGALTPHELDRKHMKKVLFEIVFGRLLSGPFVTLVTGSQIERDDILDAHPQRRVRWAGVGTRIPFPNLRVRPLSSTPRLLTMSRLAEKKRVDLAIATVAELLSRGHAVTLDICGVGSPEFEQKLVSLAIEYGVQDRVTFRGLVTGVTKEKTLLDADIFILPSEDENFGIAVAEAAAHGLAIVASDRVAAAKMLSPRVVSLVDELSAHALADGVEHWLTNFEDTTRSVAVSEATSNYSWESVAGRWVEIAKEAVA